MTGSSKYENVIAPNTICWLRDDVVPDLEIELELLWLVNLFHYYS